MADEAKQYYEGAVSEPINWVKDDDDLLVRKINSHISDAESLWNKRKKIWKRADAYLDGNPQKVNLSGSQTAEKMIYNPLFAIIRNMTGLTTDPRPHPSVKIGRISKQMLRDDIQKKMELGDKLEQSLDEWWEDERLQSWLQRMVFGLYTYSDFFAMPYWDDDKEDVCIYELSPRRVKIDPNCDRVTEAQYVIIDFYRTKAQMYKQFGEEVTKNVKYSDYKEITDAEREDYPQPDSNTKIMKNVCKLELYVTPEYWVYKVDKDIMEKKPSPVWAMDKKSQAKMKADQIRKKYEKKGIAGAVGKVVDTAKGMVGMDTQKGQIDQEITDALSTYKPKANFLKSARIPLIHFDTYRISGELYSRSVMELAIPTLDDINKRKHDIQRNSETVGNPGTVVDGNTYNENDAVRLKNCRKTGEVCRVNTSGGKSIRDSVVVLDGQPLPEQFFEDLNDSKRELDTLWGHHEVSKGGGDAANRTKGGILALQEADQTPVRYISRNIEDALQDLFGWVVQIRKMYFTDEVNVGGENFIDYSEVDDTLKVFVKSGSMLPVSKEQQRAQAIELYRISAIDPLTLHERLGESDPEQIAKRLEAWLKTKTILADGMDDQKQSAIQQLKQIQAGQPVQPQPGDDPAIHHDILLMALKSGMMTPQQENIVAQLIEQYRKMAENPQLNQPGAEMAGGQGGAPMPPGAIPPDQLPPQQ